MSACWIAGGSIWFVHNQTIIPLTAVGLGEGQQGVSIIVSLCNQQ